MSFLFPIFGYLGLPINQQFSTRALGLFWNYLSPSGLSSICSHRGFDRNSRKDQTGNRALRLILRNKIATRKVDELASEKTIHSELENCFRASELRA